MTWLEGAALGAFVGWCARWAVERFIAGWRAARSAHETASREIDGGARLGWPSKTTRKGK